MNVHQPKRGMTTNVMDLKPMVTGFTPLYSLRRASARGIEAFCIKDCICSQVFPAQEYTIFLRTRFSSLNAYACLKQA